MRTKKIAIDGGVVVVRKLPLGEYAKVFKLIKGFTKGLNEIENLETDDILKNLPVMIADAWPDAINIIVIASDLTEEKATNEIGLDDAIKIFVGIWEVNNYAEVFKTVKKALAQRTEKKESEA